jgi:hypothetical protein
MNYYKLPDSIKYIPNQCSVPRDRHKHQSHTLNYIEQNKTKWKTLVNLRYILNFLDHILPICCLILVLIIYESVTVCTQCKYRIRKEIFLFIFCISFMIVLKVINKIFMFNN